MRLRKYVILLFIFVLVLIYFATPRFIKINKVVCNNQFGKCQSEMTSTFESVKPTSLYETKKRLSGALSANYLIQKYAIRYKLPSTLEISIVENTAKYAIYESGKDIFLLIDGSGRVLSYSENTALPFLVISGEIPDVGNYVSQEILFASKIVSRLTQSNAINSANLDNGRMVVKMNNKPDLIYPTSGDIEVLLGSTVLVLSRLKQEGEDFKIEEVTNVKEIDFRFKNLVLR